MPESVQLRREVLAALTITLVGLPQCIAYALMSGVPPVYGLVTAAVPGIVAALVGRSAQIVTGPTNTTGLLILATLAPFLGPTGVIGGDALSVLATLTVLAGLLRLAIALAGGAAVLDFLPESVLTGFTTGAAVLIAVNQLDEGLGLAHVSGGSLAAQAEAIWVRLGDTGPSLIAIGLAIASAALILVGKRHRPTWPVPLLVVLVGVGVAALFSLDAGNGLPIVHDVSPVPQGWPEVRLPSTEPAVWEALIAPALAIVLLGTLEMTVSARAGGATPDLRREIVAQGAANVAGAFTGAFPASASLTRSVLLRLSGARTRLAAGLSAVFIIPVMLFGAPLTNRIPQASLAGVLYVVALSMIDRKRIRRMLAVGGDTRLLLVVTFAGTLVLPLEWAILGGAALGLVRHLDRETRPQIRGRALVGDPDTFVIEVSGSLHYAAIRNFVATFREITPASARKVMIDLTHAHHLRYAALDALERLRDELAGRGAELVLAGASPEFTTYAARAKSTLTLVSGP
jgi:SulP family sulfate permease